jgi:membrane-associated phospholipid phosphatase
MRGRPPLLGTVVVAAATHAAPRDEPILGATDVLLLAFLAGVATLTPVRHVSSLLAPIALLGGAIVLVGACARRSQRVRLVHDFFPVPVTIAIFELLGPVIPAVNPARWDTTFAALDARLFGRLPSAWFGALGRPPWLTDVASVAYVTYYLLPVVVGVALYARDCDAFRGFAFAVVATFLVSYAGYLLFPTLGPRTLDDSVLGGGAVASAVRTFVRAVEGNPLDAFPSGHTAIALVSVGWGWCLFPRWRAPLALVLGGIVFSTVYLSYHYVIDVVAGAALAALLLVVLPPPAGRQATDAHRPSSQGRHRPRSQAIRSKRPAR